MKQLRKVLLTLVRRPGAADYLLLTLLSFALSVTLTRLFLGLTGYPQLGNGTLHIAHVLWGGLFLFAAALLPLIFANRWIYRLTAILAGVGVGLFIDEIGKFITQSNDYFYQPAAPIIYAFFLACVLVYLQVSRPNQGEPRLELYAALEFLEQVLERDLDEYERVELVEHLRAAAGQTDNPELRRLATELLDFVGSDGVHIAPPSSKGLQNIRDKLNGWQRQVFERGGARQAVTIALGILGFVCVGVALLMVSPNFTGGSAGQTVLFWLEEDPGTGYAYVYWNLILAITLGVSGLLLVLSAVMLWKGQARSGLVWAYFVLVLQLTILNLLMFYYYQFITIAFAATQFVLLLAVIHYQRTGTEPSATQ